MNLVLWGRRKGDVQYNSRDFWRRNLMVGVPTITVAHNPFDVGDLLDVGSRDTVRVQSMEDRVLGVEGHAAGRLND